MASPDPLAVHSLGGGEVLNSYHYVHGNLLTARDPLGLADCEGDCSGYGHIDNLATNVSYGWGGYNIDYHYEGYDYRVFVPDGDVDHLSLYGDGDEYKLEEGPGGVLIPDRFTSESAPKLLPRMYWTHHEYGIQFDRKLFGLGVQTVVGGLFYTAGWWFNGRAMGMRGSAGSAVLANFSKVEQKVIQEAVEVLGSKQMSVLRSAHEAGRAAEVKAGSRTILYEPSMPASSPAMTLDNGTTFVLGPAAFKTQQELGRTMLHELYRVHAGKMAKEGAFSGAGAAAETEAAFSFSYRAYHALQELAGGL